MSIPRFYPSCLGPHSCQIRKRLGSGKPIWHVTLHPELISHHPLLCQTACLCPEPARSEKTKLQESMLGTNRRTQSRANNIHMLSQRNGQMRSDLFNNSIPDRKKTPLQISQKSQNAQIYQERNLKITRSQYELKHFSSNFIFIL